MTGDETARTVTLDGGTPLSLKELYRLIWRGALPAVALRDRLAWDLFHGSQVRTYLERDVRSLANVGNELTFMRFMRVTAARTSQILNLAAMARDADVSPNTAKTWLSLLQASGIACLLEPYHTNVNTRLVKAPKLYVLDTGLGAYLTQWSSPEVLEAGSMSGAFLETWAVGELLKSYWHNGRPAPFFYYRDKDQGEIASWPPTVSTPARRQPLLLSSTSLRPSLGPRDRPEPPPAWNETTYGRSCPRLSSLTVGPYKT